jgi:hypothetical protein
MRGFSRGSGCVGEGEEDRGEHIAKLPTLLGKS